MNYKAIKTEYDGVLYDSKSEAIFARLLHLSGIHLEKRHPIAHDNHEWDFLVWIKSYKTFHASSRGIDANGEPIVDAVSTFCAPIAYDPVLIELKPSKPTDQYIKSLEERISWFQGERRIIVWGSPFEKNLQQWFDGYFCRYLSVEIGKNRTFRIGETLPAHMTLEPFDDNLIGKAMEYRFDLEGGGLRR